jgi:hypothetical protein
MKFNFVLSVFSAFFVMSMQLNAFQRARFPYQSCYLRAFSKMKHNVHDDESKVLKSLREMKLSPSSTFLLSVSGGSDSMAMFHLFKAIQDGFWKDMQLKVIHFNHKMRQESDEEVRTTRSSLFFYSCCIVRDDTAMGR